MFVGRDEELRELGHAIASAKSRGTYVAFVGEPGIGKTRLAEEASVLAREAGYRVAWGRCWEAGGAPPLWPWIEALRELGIADGWERAGGEQFEVFDGVMRALRQAAETQPIALVLDDLHAADRASLVLLQFVTRQLRFAHVLVIATYRDVEARMRDDVATLLAKPAREGKALLLDRLGRDDVAKLAADRTDADALFRSSEGNPLFVHELLLLVEWRGDAVAIPDGIREVIGERLALVDPEARRALQIASVLGREFDADLVRALGGGSLDAAVRAGLVVASGDRVRFTHVRIRDVLYAELADKAALHAAAAAALEQRGADASVIAHHWFAANDDRAIAAAVRAADAASQRLAFADAAALLERAHARAPQRDDLAIALGTALIRAGRPDEGQRLCAAAARSPDPTLAARAALAYGQVYRFGTSDATMVALLEGALAGLPPGDTPLRAQLLGRLAGALQPANDLAVPVAAARRAIELARRIGDPSTLASVLVSAGSAMQDVCDAAERLPNNEELVRLAVASGDPLLAARGQLRLAFDHLELGNVEAADGAFRAHVDLLAEQRNPRLHWPSEVYRAMRADMAGRFAEADDHIAQARRFAERAGDAGARITMAMHAVCTAFVRDALDELNAAEPLLAEYAYHPAVHQILGALIAARLGRIEEARTRATVTSPSWYQQTSAGTCMAELSAIAKPDPEVFEGIKPLAAGGRSGVWSMTAIVSLGPVARPMSLLAAALDRWDDAEQFAQQALEAALRQGHVPVLARTRFEWGTALIRRGKPEGRALVDEARATAEALGMTALATACRGTVAPRVAVPAAVTPTPLAPVTIDRDGDTWHLRWAREQARVRDSRGIQMIADLVARAGDDVHVLDLTGSVDSGDAGDVLDRTAIETYKRRILELTSELEAAEERHDLGRGERLREELEALEDEVARAVGLGGRVRKSSSSVERARSNVQRRIKSAIAQVEKLNAPIGQHLARSVRTGSFCSYLPRSA